jgi:low temperature requirement protein LtrA
MALRRVRASIASGRLMVDTQGPPASGSDSEGERHASWIELFFGLVSVVAVAQLDEGFLDDPGFVRALVMVGLFVPV